MPREAHPRVDLHPWFTYKKEDEKHPGRHLYHCRSCGVDVRTDKLVPHVKAKHKDDYVLKTRMGCDDVRAPRENEMLSALLQRDEIHIKRIAALEELNRILKLELENKKVVDELLKPPRESKKRKLSKIDLFFSGREPKTDEQELMLQERKKHDTHETRTALREFLKTNPDATERDMQDELFKIIAEQT